MTGLDLSDTSLNQNTNITDAANKWIAGDGIVSMESPKRQSIRITFVSAFGTFDRRIRSRTTMTEIYQLAFRGMNGRHTVFQLVKNNAPIPTGGSSASLHGIADGDRLSVRIADEIDRTPTTSQRPGQHSTSGDLCLVKVYTDPQVMDFAFWVRGDTTLSLSSIIWKYFRHHQSIFSPSITWRVWTSLRENGDGMLQGQECTGSENLVAFLNAEYCFGRLTTEPVTRSEDVIASDGVPQPPVLKVMVLRAKQRADRMRETKLSRLDVLKQMFEVCTITQGIRNPYRLQS